MIKLAAWNIRGLNDPLKKKEIRSFVRVHSISVVCILETRVKSSNMDRICASILPGWGLIHNYDHALLGRIWVCWNTSVVSIDAINLRLSDHCPLIVNLNNCKDPSPKKSYTFKFFNFWANHPAFLDLVKDAWNIEFYGTPMYKLTQKLKSVKTRLKDFNFHVFSNIREKVVDAREALQHAQAARLGNPNDPSLVENEKVCLKIFHDLALAEESFLKQKSRI